ncbi:hypothetical protein [Thermocrinis sp.]|jgi:hypothetical protein|uniref:hypothetical protein n=1 Tax=Thermocrinis sp. TaxID=2024383 RepID=UPI003C01D8EF
MSKKVKKVMVIDSQWYLGADQIHLITQLRKKFPEAPIYFAVNTKVEYWQKVGEKLRSLWESRGVHLEETEKIEMDMIDKLASKHKAEKVVIGTNDSILLTTLTGHPTLRPIYLRITYKRNRYEWHMPHPVFEELREIGYTVIDIRLANRIEGSLARILGLSFDAVLKLWDEKERFEESVQTAREKVLPKMDGELTLQDFKDMCFKEGIAYPFESAYFLAYYGDIKLRNNRGNVFLLRNVNTSTEAEEQEDPPKDILSRIFHPFLRFFPKSKNE